MTVPFTLECPKIILFGSNERKKLPEIIRPYGEKVLILMGEKALAKSGWLEQMKILLKDFSCLFFACPPGEPTVESINIILQKAKEFAPNLIIGLGGGSILDSAKAVSGLIDKAGCVEDYMEGLGTGKTINRPGVPWLAMPTTAGTGTEATKNAVIKATLKSDPYGYKKSIRSPALLPDYVIIDPDFTLHLSLYQTGISGLDALSQLIEAYVSQKAKPIPQALIEDAFPVMLQALEVLATDLQNQAARADAAYGALISGIALANAGLGAVHGFASGLGGMFGIPHGLICASFLIPVLDFNRPAIEKKIRKLMKRYVEKLGARATGTDTNMDYLEKPIEALKSKISGLLNLYHLENEIKKYLINQNDIPEIARRSAGSSMSGNPLELTQEDKEQILNQVLFHK